MSSISEQVKKIPNSPGVYLFLNKKGVVLYVGKATSLKRRTSSYFQKVLDPRLREMLAKASNVKYKKTDNVLEAIILEANLIKKYWPKYNVKEKDNRSFIYVVIPKIDFPQPFLVRERELNKITPNAEVFGPYQSFSLIKNSFRIIRKIFPYSTCKPFSGEPCFNHQIGLCPGLCVGKISKKDYQKNIDNIILLLKGQKKKLLKKLKKENPDMARSLNHIQDVALLAREEISGASFYSHGFNKIEGYDISHLSGKETIGALVSFVNATADKNSYRLFNIRQAPANDDLRALEEMINRRFKHREWAFPDLILIDGGRPQVSFISKTLKANNINIPLVGISKLSNDKLVFPDKMKLSLKKLIQTIKRVLLEVRNEAHRFALKNSCRQRIMLK